MTVVLFHVFISQEDIHSLHCFQVCTLVLQTLHKKLMNPCSEKSSKCQKFFFFGEQENLNTVGIKTLSQKTRLK